MLPLIDFGFIQIPSYFVFMPLAFCVGLWFYYRQLIKQNLPTRQGLDLAFFALLGAFVGARAFHIFYEHPHFYWHHPENFYRFWQGGFVFYGGVLGALFCGLLYLRWQKTRVLIWLNAIAMSFPPAYILGRFATLLSGSGYGRVIEDSVARNWSITYPLGSEAPAGLPLHPTPIYSILWTAGVWLVLRQVNQYHLDKKKVMPAGLQMWILFVGHGIGRLWIEFFRDDDRGPPFLAMSVSSLMSCFLIFTGIYLIFKKSPHFKSS